MKPTILLSSHQMSFPVGRGHFYFASFLPWLATHVTVTPFECFFPDTFLWASFSRAKDIPVAPDLKLSNIRHKKEGQTSPTTAEVDSANSK